MRNKQYTTREKIFEYVRKNYGSLPEYLWKSAPHHAVLRHDDNKKWYAVIMNVKRDTLCIPGSGSVDILNVKCDPLLVGSALMQHGFLPAYHMNKSHWISILLDGSVSEENILFFLNMSFDITAKKKTLNSSAKK